MIKVRLIDVLTSNLIGDYPADGISVTDTIDQIGKFSFNIEESMLNGNPIDLGRNMLAQIQNRSEIVVQGPVDSIKPDKGVYNFNCNMYMEALSKERSKSNAKYQDQQFISIVLDLLTYAPAWKLGDIVTMVDFFVTTTIDLRGEETLFAQIKKLVDAVPDMFMRYGGTDGTYYYLDFGLFDERINPPIGPNDIIDLSREVKYSDVLQIIEAYGGEITVAGVKRGINLDDALDYDASLATHPDYPIVTDKGVSVVKNNAVVIGASITKTYREISPETKVDPPAAEIEEAGYALWQKGAVELSKAAEIEYEWSANLKAIPPGLKVGDRVHITGNAWQVFHDYLSQRTSRLNLGMVSEWFRVISLAQKIDKEELTWDLKITPNLRLSTDDPFVILYDIMNPKVDQDSSSNSIDLNQFGMLTDTVPQGLTPDTFNGTPDDYYPAVLYTIPLGSVPMGATTVTIYKDPFSKTKNVDIRIVTPPALPSTDAVVAVSVNRNWTIDNTVEVYILVEYT